MLHELPSLLKLLTALQHVPFLASKNIYRVGAYFLHMDQSKIEQFCAVLIEARNNITMCQNCFFWVERDKSCSLCHAKKRDASVVCVVETWQELLTIEKTGGYAGMYHVLGGVICPLDGVGPEDLTIEQLVVRVDRGGIAEIILATNQTPEGEATAAYIAKKLHGKSLKISCLARGIPVGSSLEYMDRLTVFKALTERRPF